MDQIDKQILEILKENARAGYTEIGSAIGLSRVTVKNRMDALEERNVIKGYKVILEETSPAKGVLFVMDIYTEPELFESIAERLSYDSRIRKIYGTTGSAKIHAVGYAANAEEVGTFIRKVFGHTKGILKLQWDILTSVLKDVDGGVDYVSIKRKEQENSVRNE